MLSGFHTLNAEIIAAVTTIFATVVMSDICLEAAGTVDGEPVNNGGRHLLPQSLKKTSDTADSMQQDRYTYQFPTAYHTDLAVCSRLTGRSHPRCCFYNTRLNMVQEISGQTNSSLFPGHHGKVPGSLATKTLGFRCVLRIVVNTQQFE